MKIQRLPPTTSKLAYLGCTCNFLVKVNQKCQITMTYGQKITVLKDCPLNGYYSVFYEVMQLGQHILSADQYRFVFTVVNPFNLRTKIVRSKLYDILEVQLVNMTDQTIFLQEFALLGNENGLNNAFSSSFYSKVRQDQKVDWDHPLETEVFKPKSMAIFKGATFVQSFLTPQNNSESFEKIEMRYISANGELGHLQTPTIPKRITNAVNDIIKFKVLTSRVQPLETVKIQITSFAKMSVMLYPNQNVSLIDTVLELTPNEIRVIECQIGTNKGFLELGHFTALQGKGSIGHCIVG